MIEGQKNNPEGSPLCTQSYYIGGWRDAAGLRGQICAGVVCDRRTTPGGPQTENETGNPFFGGECSAGVGFEVPYAVASIV